jgi:hypothetical protein
MMRLDSIGIEIGAATAQGLPRANPVVALLGAAATLVLAQQAGAAAATATSPLIGHLDSVTVATGEVVLHWWAADLITPHISTHIRYTVGTAASGQWLAQDSRPDVGLAYPSLGDGHGFNVPVYEPLGGYVVDVANDEPGAGPANSLGCLRAAVPADYAPIGHLDAARSVGNSHIEVRGWTFDPDTSTTASTIGIYVGGQPATRSSPTRNAPTSLAPTLPPRSRASGPSTGST